MLAASKVCGVCGCWQTLDTSPVTINPVVYVDHELVVCRDTQNFIYDGSPKAVSS